MLKRTSRFFIFSLLANLLGLAEAHASFPLPPRFSANALASDYAVGQVDMMLPVSGDCAHNLYFDPDIAYGSDNQGYADLGLGYRWIQNNAAILGAYLFGGYSRIDNNARLWVVNPGIEAMGRRWDARLNAYFPMGDRNYSLGNAPILRFSGHSAFLDTYHISQHVGDGADIKLGYQLFPRTPLKAYLGSYFFSPSQTSNIWGGAAGFEYWFDSHVKFMVGYTYDTLRHSTGALGIGVEFGGTHVHRSDPCLEERITDPVDRYLSELGRGSAIPSRKSSQLLAGSLGSQLLFNNVAFFSQTGTPNTGGTALSLANCTFEDPCGPTDFSQPGVNTLNGLLPNTLMYFNGGSYPALNVAGTGPITLNAGQSVRSRTPDYSAPATGTARSTFNGAFILNSNNTLNNIILLSTAATAGGNGVQANSASNILINGSQVGSSASPFFTAMLLTSSTNAMIQNSALVGGGNIGSAALVLNTSSSATVQNSDLQSISSSGPAEGIDVLSSSTVTVQNSTINANSATAGAANGIFLSTGSATANITQSQISATGSDAGNIMTGFRTNTAGNTVNATGVQVSATNLSSGGANTLRNNVVGSTITVTNGVLAATGSGALIKNATPTITITSSTCTVNGGSIVCP